MVYARDGKTAATGAVSVRVARCNVHTTCCRPAAAAQRSTPIDFRPGTEDLIHTGAAIVCKTPGRRLANHEPTCVILYIYTGHLAFFLISLFRHSTNRKPLERAILVAGILLLHRALDAARFGSTVSLYLL